MLKAKEQASENYFLCLKNNQKDIKDYKEFVDNSIANKGIDKSEPLHMNNNDNLLHDEL